MGVVYWSPVCTTIGLVNLGVFILIASSEKIGFPLPYLAFPSEGAHLYQYLSSLVVHQSWVHLTNNAFSLFAFGCYLEKRIGSSKFLLVYLISGLGGNILFAIMSQNQAVVGASGAIFGIICCMVFLDPKSLVITPGAPLPLPILFFAVFYIGNEVFLSLGNEAYLNLENASKNIAHVAHVGGGIGGAIVGKILSGRKKTIEI